ncbi:PQ loop repeat-domain-containing protein [Immersiella caudata]|uniref:PQ loop repeat-domain-containing protein n=1 Tax=Immersiella caudata TaxID=314043 RepID=A0AA39WWT0_9PEZI|nr:PQ loop repeat-domain-containing protein [Immersiella caudata]
MDTPAAANVLGTLGAVCWSIQLIPQIIVNYRRHHATGLQPSMMMLWAWAGVPLGVFNIVSEFNIALRIQPQLLTFLSLITWIQCYYYQKKWSPLKSLLVLTPIALVMSAIQAALIISLRLAKSRHNTTWPMTLMAVLSAVLLAAGVLRHYFDIYKHRTVRGISFLFVGIDAAGDVFSLASLFFQKELDVLGCVIYGTELALWLGVFACGGWYNLGPWVRGKLEDRDMSRGDGERNGVAMHEMPSSTSVFRTASGGSGLRERTAGGMRRGSLGRDEGRA